MSIQLLRSDVRKPEISLRFEDLTLDDDLTVDGLATFNGGITGANIFAQDERTIVLPYTPPVEGVVYQNLTIKCVKQGNQLTIQMPSENSPVVGITGGTSNTNFLSWRSNNQADYDYLVPSTTNKIHMFPVQMDFIQATGATAGINISSVGTMKIEDNVPGARLLFKLYWTQSLTDFYGLFHVPGTDDFNLLMYGSSTTYKTLHSN